MRFRESKNEQAVGDAIALFQYDEECREKFIAAGVSHPGPRGIVNARRLGLSKRRIPASRTIKRNRRKAQLALTSRRSLCAA